MALNKWSVDRFASTGPHHTPNLQLVDISRPDGMQVLYDVPCPDGEPHYAQILSVDRLKPWPVYPNGWNAGTQSKDPNATKPRKERIVRRGDTVEIWATATRTYFAPDEITVREGDKVIWHITSPERTQNASHGLIVPGYDISTIIDPGQTLTVSFVADKAGTFPFYCPEFCSALHMEMMGYFLVQPAGGSAN